MRRVLLMTTAVTLVAAAPAVSKEALHSDPQFGRQMTVSEMKRDLVGSSLLWSDVGGENIQYVAEGGKLRGATPKGERYAINWRFREYDNLFCEETGDPASSGCVQMLRKGNKISFRRKDGLVEFTATIMPGNPFGM